MEKSKMTEQEGLFLIQQMINTAKQEQKDDGRGWILWGWLLFAASVLTALNQRFHWTDSTFLFWNIFGGVTVLYFVYSTIRYSRFTRTERVKTYTGDLFKRLNAGFFISLFFIILSLNLGARAVTSRFGVFDITPINTGFALLINLYSFWILIYGTALDFKPSIYGAYGSWLFGIWALFVSSFESVMWLHACAVAVGYIIPGHLARKAFQLIRKKRNKRHVFKDLDPILHSQLRLAVMSLLIGVKEAEFTFIREKTGATAGNLSVQVQKLREAGYIDVTKQFKDNYPQTLCRVTAKGIEAFEQYVKALQAYIGK